jgi:uncharacterized protein (TIGR03435 family)
VTNPRHAATITLVVLAACAVVAQDRRVSLEPAFEVASVKPNPSRTGIRGHSFPGNRFEAKNVEPGQPLPESQVAGPAWIDSDRFDVSAAVGTDRPNTVTQKQLMVRALLTARFKLAAHFESRDSPAYALIVAKKDGGLGPKLRQADVDCEALLATQPGQRERCILYALPSGKLVLRGQTMSAFANALTRMLARPVIDRTGLRGGFDADADFDPQSVPGMPQVLPEDRPKDAPSLDAALRETLGLKLESTHAPVKRLVIDYVERPTPD